MQPDLGNLIQRYEVGGLKKITKLLAPPRVELYEDGVIHRAGKQIDVLRWDEIMQMRVEADALAAQRTDESTFAFINEFGDTFYTMIPAIIQQAGRVLAREHIAQVDAGETVTYGRFSIDPVARVLHLPFGDEIGLTQIEVRVPLIEQRFVIFDEHAAAEFDKVAEQVSDEGDSPFLRPKWFRPYGFSDVQPYPRFLAVLAHLGVPVHLIGTRTTATESDDLTTATFKHTWARD